MTVRLADLTAIAAAQFRHVSAASIPVGVATRLAALALVLGAGLPVGAQPPPAFDTPTATDVKDAPADDSAGEKALVRFRALGAKVFDTKIDTHCEIEIWANIDSSGRYIAIELGRAWKGTDADLALIGKMFSLGDVELGVDLESVSPAALAELKLRAPLAALRLDSTDQRLDQLTDLPPCRLLGLGSGELTAARGRHVMELAANVESLTLFGDRSENPLQGPSDEDLAQLSQLTKLKRLQIWYCPITDAGLKHLVQIKSLESLRFEGCLELARSDFAGLVGADRLRTLEIDGPLSAAAVANIARLDSLKTLKFHIDDLGPEDIEPLAKLIHLQELSVEKERADNGLSKRSPETRLAEVPIGNAIARAAGQMPTLQTLLIDAAIDHEGLELVVAAKQLQSLTVEPAEVDDRALKLAAGLPGLKRLRLFGEGKLTDQGLAHLASVTALVELRLPGAGITDAAMTHLAGLTALEELGLQGANITTAGLASLDRLGQLHDLDLLGSSIDDAGCQLLPKYFPHLSTLDLRKCKISDVGIDSIADLPEVYFLALDRTAITNAGLAKLGRMKGLRFLSVSNTAADEEGIDAIKRAIPGLNVALRGVDAVPLNTNDMHRNPSLEIPDFTPLPDDALAADQAPAAGRSRPATIEPDGLSVADDGSPGAKAFAR
ncbi:MAG TPA: hypothetical protein VGG30_11475, partial [Pirellulales bacterium]